MLPLACIHDDDNYLESVTLRVKYVSIANISAHWVDMEAKDCCYYVLMSMTTTTLTCFEQINTLNLHTECVNMLAILAYMAYTEANGNYCWHLNVDLCCANKQADFAQGMCKTYLLH